MRRSIFTFVLLTSVALPLSAMAGLDKHDRSIATYGYNIDIATGTGGPAGSDLKDELDRGAVREGVMPRGTVVEEKPCPMPAPMKQKVSSRAPQNLTAPTPVQPQAALPSPMPPVMAAPAAPQLQPQPMPQPAPQAQAMMPPVPSPMAPEANAQAAAPQLIPPAPQDEMSPQKMNMIMPGSKLPPSHPDFLKSDAQGIEI